MKSAYIHIPFCKTICTYCDFCKMFYDNNLVSKYLDKLEEEINTNYKGEVLDTIYIGGGTPNCLTDKQLIKLFDIINKLNKSNNCEVTIECNIELLTLNQIEIFKNNINRISIGVQTFNPKYIKYLGRHHTKEEVFTKIQLLKDNGINNINVDLIYAIKGQTIDELKEDIIEFKKLDIPHISTYSLIIEDHTVLGINKEEYINEDLDCDMYNLIIDSLSNYDHYELSNFAIKGYESRHNLTYWNNNRYYGFGLGASGYIDNIRYDNTRSINKYLNGDIIYESHELSRNETIENEFILGFRKMNGINIDTFYIKYNINILDIDKVKKLLEKNKLILKDSYLYINKKYLYVSNDILVEFIGENYEK